MKLNIKVLALAADLVWGAGMFICGLIKMKFKIQDLTLNSRAFIQGGTVEHPETGRMVRFISQFSALGK